MINNILQLLPSKCSSSFRSSTSRRFQLISTSICSENIYMCVSSKGLKYFRELLFRHQKLKLITHMTCFLT